MTKSKLEFKLASRECSCRGCGKSIKAKSQMIIRADTFTRENLILCIECIEYAYKLVTGRN